MCKEISVSVMCRETMEKRDVCFIEMPTAFMQAEINDTVHVKRREALQSCWLRIIPSSTENIQAMKMSG